MIRKFPYKVFTASISVLALCIYPTISFAQDCDFWAGECETEAPTQPVAPTPAPQESQPACDFWSGECAAPEKATIAPVSDFWSKPHTETIALRRQQDQAEARLRAQEKEVQKRQQAELRRLENEQRKLERQLEAEDRSRRNSRHSRDEEVYTEPVNGFVAFLTNKDVQKTIIDAGNDYYGQKAENARQRTRIANEEIRRNQEASDKRKRDIERQLEQMRQSRDQQQRDIERKNQQIAARAAQSRKSLAHSRDAPSITIPGLVCEDDNSGRVDWDGNPTQRCTTNSTSRANPSSSRNTSSSVASSPSINYPETGRIEPTQDTTSDVAATHSYAVCYQTKAPVKPGNQRWKCHGTTQLLWTSEETLEEATRMAGCKSPRFASDYASKGCHYVFSCPRPQEKYHTDILEHYSLENLFSYAGVRPPKGRQDSCLAKSFEPLPYGVKYETPRAN